MLLKIGFFTRWYDIDWWYQREATIIIKSMINVYTMDSSAIIPIIALTNNAHSFFLNQNLPDFLDDSFKVLPRFLRRYENSNTRLILSVMS